MEEGMKKEARLEQHLRQACGSTPQRIIAMVEKHGSLHTLQKELKCGGHQLGL